MIFRKMIIYGATCSAAGSMRNAAPSSTRLHEQSMPEAEYPNCACHLLEREGNKSRWMRILERLIP